MLGVRLATADRWVFVAALVAAVPILASAGRDQWFFQDEWWFLSDRDGGSLDDLLRPHNEHWSTISIVAYRLLWNVVGLRTYLPYQAMIIVLHLVVVVLLRAVMRRTGVSPWIATAAAVALLLYGTGSENLVWGVQVGFASSMALGLGALLLADAPAPSRRRRAAVYACGAGSLMASGIGLVMLGVLALALVLRRGWRAAATACVPLAAVYGLWWSVYGRAAGSRPVPSVGQVLDFVRTGLRAALVGLGQSEVVAVLLVLVPVAALGAVAWATWQSPPDTGVVRHLCCRFGLPVALAAGAVVFLGLSGVSRAAVYGSVFATRGRYSYVVMALLLPVIASGLDTVVRRWPRALVPALVLVLIGVPGNVAAIDVRGAHNARKDLLLAVANSDLIATVDPSTRLFEDTVGARGVTAGWLHDGVASGRIPEPDEVTGETEADVAALLAVRVVEPEGEPGECRPLQREEVVEVGQGEAVGFAGALWVQVEGRDGALSADRPIGSYKKRDLTTAGPPLSLRVRPREFAFLCG